MGSNMVDKDATDSGMNFIDSFIGQKRSQDQISNTHGEMLHKDQNENNFGLSRKRIKSSRLNSTCGSNHLIHSIHGINKMVDQQYTQEIKTSGFIREAPGLWVCPYCKELPTSLRPAGWAFLSADNTAPKFLFTTSHFSLCSKKNIHNIDMHNIDVLKSICRQAKQTTLRNINGCESDKQCAREVTQAHPKVQCSSYYNPSLKMSSYQKMGHESLNFRCKAIEDIATRQSRVNALSQYLQGRASMNLSLSSKPGGKYFSCQNNHDNILMNQTLARPNNLAAPFSERKKPIIGLAELIDSTVTRQPGCDKLQFQNIFDRATLQTMYRYNEAAYRSTLRKCSFRGIPGFTPDLQRSKVEELGGCYYKQQSNNIQNLLIRGNTEKVLMNEAKRQISAFCDKTRHYSLKSSTAKDVNIVLSHNDRAFLTDYFFFVLMHLSHCEFCDDDRKARGGKRKTIPIGYKGLQCRHCEIAAVRAKSNASKGSNSSVRKFFWSDVQRLANSFSEIQNHIFKCSKCPDDIKAMLRVLKKVHPCQMGLLPRGSQKTFFRNMWTRLHGTNDRSKT